MPRGEGDRAGCRLLRRRCPAARGRASGASGLRVGRGEGLGRGDGTEREASLRRGGGEVAPSRALLPPPPPAPEGPRRAGGPGAAVPGRRQAEGKRPAGCEWAPPPSEHAPAGAAPGYITGPRHRQRQQQRRLRLRQGGRTAPRSGIAPLRSDPQATLPLIRAAALRSARSPAPRHRSAPLRPALRSAPPRTAPLRIVPRFSARCRTARRGPSLPGRRCPPEPRRPARPKRRAPLRRPRPPRRAAPRAAGWPRSRPS